MRKISANKSLRPAPMVGILLVAGMVALSGCAAAPKGPEITGKARIQTALPPGESRTLTLSAAYGDAFSQIIELARKENAGGGQTIGQMMDSSSYVASRVRRAVQRSKVIRQKFYDDGQGVVVVELDMDKIRTAAIEAQSELK